MKFNSPTDKDGAMQFIESLCKLGFGGITSDANLFAEITAYFNLSCKNIGISLLRFDKNWKFDDPNYNDFPVGTIDLVNGQRDYTLPAAVSGGNFSTLYRIKQVRIMSSNGLYSKIDLANLREVENTDSTNTGSPIKYRIIGGSIRLDPVPATGYVTMTAGLEIKFQRAPVEFTVASTTQQPGFIDAYHDLPCYDAAAKYLLPTNRQLALDYMGIYDVRLKLLQRDYASMNDDSPKRITRAKRSFR